MLTCQLKLPDPAAAERLRGYCNEINYTRLGIREVLIDNELSSPKHRNKALLVDRSRPGGPRRALIRLFLIGEPIPRTVAGEHLPEWVLETCLESGLLELSGENLRPTAAVGSFQHLLLASDPVIEIATAANPDVVLGVNRTTWMLYNLTIRQNVNSALDLGTGCGVHALCAAAHSRQVVATDLNPRAAEFARFNACLNACDNIEILVGDTFRPVAGRRFDLIITNPPFFISPWTKRLFCDNSGVLDGYCRDLIAQAPDYLEDRGVLQMMFEWVQIAGENWRDRLTSWFADTGCDAWVLRINSTEAGRYAHDRICETTPPDPEADQRNFDEWMAFYEQHRVEAIHAGLLTLRKRSGRNWIRLSDLPPGVSEPFGHVIERGLAGLDLASSSTDQELLNLRLRLFPSVRLDQPVEFRDGAWRAGPLTLRLTDGVPFETRLEPQVAGFLRSLENYDTLGDAVRALAARWKEPPTRVEAECLAITRRLIERGFLCWVKPGETAPGAATGTGS